MRLEYQLRHKPPDRSLVLDRPLPLQTGSWHGPAKPQPAAGVSQSQEDIYVYLALGRNCR
jgi:hypothetical protein